MIPIPPELPRAFSDNNDGALERLVYSQVHALLDAAPVSSEIEQSERDALEEKVRKIAGHVAGMALEDWKQSEKLGQRPLVKTTEQIQPVARAQVRNDFEDNATSRVADVTRSTLRAIAFPTFVADLINGVFSAILDATTTQMGAFMEMLEGVSKTVEEFENENVNDQQAQQWLAQKYPGHFSFTVDGIEVTNQEAPAGLRGVLNLPGDIEILDEVTLEEQLVPAVRRKLAQSRLQMLSTLVMMGLQRIVVNHGRIRATMGFRIDATDTASDLRENLTDVSTGIAAGGAFGPITARVNTSITYVNSSRSESNSELNVNANLTGEVDLTFSTDYMPLNRMATTERIARIRNNTPNPGENAPASQAGAAPSGADQQGRGLMQYMGTRRPAEVPQLPQSGSENSADNSNGDSADNGNGDSADNGNGNSADNGNGNSAASQAQGIQPLNSKAPLRRTYA